MASVLLPIRPVDVSEVPHCAEVLARAFHDDPMFTFSVDSSAERARLLPAYFAAVLRSGFRYGAADAAEGLAGAAIWLAPGNAPLTVPRLAETGVLQALMAFGQAGFEPFRAVASRFEEARRRAVPVPNWYLMVLGVDPASQGCGVGGQLLRPVLDRADAAGLPCTLETVNEQNIPFYERHGFRVTIHGELTDGAPPFWSMAREPVAAVRAADSVQGV